MAEHERDCGERRLSYGDAVAFLRARLGGSIGKAQQRLRRAHLLDGLQPHSTKTGPRLPPTWAADFPWEQVEYNASDLEDWASKELDFLNRLAANKTAWAAATHTYRNVGDAELVECGEKLVRERRFTQSAAAREVTGEGDGPRFTRIRKAIGQKLTVSGAKDSQS